MYCTISPLAFTASLLSILNQVSAHSRGDPNDVDDTERLSKLQEKWGTDWAFHGISTFAHLPHKRCLTDFSEKFDIGIIGAPFDNAVSYRPGARFGPRAIRAASARQLPFRGFNHRAGLNPYQNWAHVLDCGDIPITPFDNAMAERQMTEAFRELLGRETIAAEERRPRLLTLGGDHSIALPALRALHDIYGRITVVHFDAHLDTWHPGKYPNAWLAGDNEHEQSFFNHGSMFWLASRESLLSNASVHAGLRTRLSGDDYADYADDDAQGWLRIASDDIDDLGVTGIANTIVQHIGEDAPVYLSVDIDVIDPGLAPGTGTPEPGGWLSRELIRILRGIESLNVVGADIVEVSPAFDGTGEETALVAAQVGFEIVTSMVVRGIKEDVLKKGSAEAYSRATEPKKSKATGKAGDVKDEL